MHLVFVVLVCSFVKLLSSSVSLICFHEGDAGY